MPDDIEMKKFEAIEMKPGKYYLIMFDQESVQKRDMQALARKLAEDGIKGVLVAVRGTDGVTIVEADEGKFDQKLPQQVGAPA